MSWKCFFLGCRWHTRMRYKDHGEFLNAQVCKRCGSKRIVTD